MKSGSQFLIQDPYHEYGASFIEHIHRQYGHRAVCFYTDRHARFAMRGGAAHREAVDAEYDIDLCDLDAFIAHVRTAHNVIAVVPFSENVLLPAAQIAAQLGLKMIDPAVLRRFRDKFALKEHLRQTAPALRMNASALVRGPADVLALRELPCYRRFILKPNDGYGNRCIGLFERSDAARSIDDYFNSAPASQIVMEEFIDGVEYFVNGQVDAAGDVVVLAIFEYVRCRANGRHNIDAETILVKHGTALFDRLAAYAESVIRATGLRRSPFHLEVKLDDAGPCLIEVAARLAGNSNAVLCGELHGPQLDLIALASRHYLSDAVGGAEFLDWARYNSQSVRYVHGIASRSERIWNVAGLRAVEAMPEFHGWIRRPTIGQRLAKTTDCLSMPWSLVLKADSDVQAARAAAAARGLIRWDRPALSLATVAAGLPLLRRVLGRLCRSTLQALIASNRPFDALAAHPVGAYGPASCMWDPAQSAAHGGEALASSAIFFPAQGRLAESAEQVLTCEVATCLDELRALRPEYDRLHGLVGGALPFSRHEWHVAWCRHFMRDSPHMVMQPMIHVLRDSKHSCVAIFPFFKTRRRVGPLDVVTLDFLGADPALTEIRTPLIEPGYERAAAHAMQRALESYHDVDWIQWHGVSEAFEQSLARFAELRWQDTLTDYVLDLPCSWELLHRTLKRNIRESIRHCYNSLQREGLRFELKIAQLPLEVEEALERFFVLHSMRAELGGTVGHADHFRSATARGFLRDVCAQFARVGMVRVFELWIGGQIVATRIAFQIGDSLYFYYSGYDPAWRKYSVMTTCVTEMLKYAIGAGLATANLSLGTDISKTRWGPRAISIRQATQVKPSLRSRLAWAAYRRATSGPSAPAWIARISRQVKREWA
jgi:CelD/BcsL family acetyltransferase involved in cellulose biosynthesis